MHVKVVRNSNSKPLNIVFNNSAIDECFPNEQKKENVIPVYKKDDKINNKKIPTSVTLAYFQQNF